MNMIQNDSNPLVDEEGALKRLGGDRQLFSEFISIFMEDSEILMNQIGEGLKDTDAEKVCQSGHAFKGLVSNFGAKECVDVALRLELAGRAGDVSSCEEDFETLKQLHVQMKDELKALS